MREDAHEAIVAQIETRNPAICGGDPDGLQIRRVERAHQMQYQNADGSGVSEERDAPAAMLFDGLVELS